MDTIPTAEALEWFQAGMWAVMKLALPSLMLALAWVWGKKFIG